MTHMAGIVTVQGRAGVYAHRHSTVTVWAKEAVRVEAVEAVRVEAVERV